MVFGVLSVSGRSLVCGTRITETRQQQPPSLHTPVKCSSFWARRLTACCSPTSTECQGPDACSCGQFPPNKGSCDQDRKGCCRVSLACGFHSMWRRWAGAQGKSGGSVRAERPLLWRLRTSCQVATDVNFSAGAYQSSCKVVPPHS